MATQTNNTVALIAAFFAGAVLLFGGLALSGAFEDEDLNVGQDPAVEVNLPDTIEIGNKKEK